MFVLFLVFFLYIKTSLEEGLLTINTIFNHNIQLPYKIGTGEKQIYIFRQKEKKEEEKKQTKFMYH